VRRWATGFWELGGGGLREGWVKGGQFTSNLRPRWTDLVTARRVPSKWTKDYREQGEQRERGEQGEQGEQVKRAEGNKECKGNAPCI
jgi:hypothetical protein